MDNLLYCWQAGRSWKRLIGWRLASRIVLWGLRWSRLTSFHEQPLKANIAANDASHVDVY